MLQMQSTNAARNPPKSHPFTLRHCFKSQVQFGILFQKNKSHLWHSQMKTIFKGTKLHHHDPQHLWMEQRAQQHASPQFSIQRQLFDAFVSLQTNCQFHLFFSFCDLAKMNTNKGIAT